MVPDLASLRSLLVLFLLLICLIVLKRIPSQVDVVINDLEKAFDTVAHGLLINEVDMLDV